MADTSWARANGETVSSAAGRWPVLARCPEALAWLQVQADLGLAPRTLEAYSRGLADYLTVCTREEIEPLSAGRAEVARYVRDLARRPHPRGATIVSLDSGVGLANATLQQRLVIVRLFYDHLIEEGRRDTNPSGGAGTHPAARSAASASAAWCHGSRSCRGFRPMPSGSKSSRSRGANHSEPG